MVVTKSNAALEFHHPARFICEQGYITKACNKTEFAFFQWLLESKEKETSELAKCIPKVISFMPAIPKSLVKMEDATPHAKYVSRMDIALTYWHSVITKNERRDILYDKIMKATFQGKIGVRIKYCHMETNDGMVKDLVLNLSTTYLENSQLLNTIDDALKIYDIFFTLNKAIAIDKGAMKYYIDECNKIYEAIAQLKNIAFDKCSLLIFYAPYEKIYKVKLIDFSCCFMVEDSKQCEHKKFLFALRNAINLLEMVQKNAS